MNFLYVQHCMCGVANQMPTMFTVHVPTNKRGATKIDLLFALNMKHRQAIKNSLVLRRRRASFV